MSEISITLPDGSVRSLPEGATGADLAASIGPRLAKDAVVVEVDGEPRDLTAPLADGDVGSHRDRPRPRRPPPPPTLDRPRPRPGRARAVAGGHVRRRTRHRQRLLLRLRAAGRSHVHRRRPRAHRREDARDHRRRPAVRALRTARRRGRALMADHPYKRAFMDLAAEGDDADGEAGSGGHDQLLPQHTRVRGHVPRPARAEHRSTPALQADAPRRGVLPGQREEPDAPAHLRHGVGHEDGPRRLPADARVEAASPRPPQARCRARPVLVPRGDRLAASRSSIRRAASSAA